MAINHIRTVIFSLAFCFTAVSNVLGATVKQDVQGHATNSTSVIPGEVYHEPCVDGYCRWQCNDDSDWCWVATVSIGQYNENEAHWVTCSSDQECATKMDKLRNPKCKSVWKGYRGLSDLKCVAKDMQRFEEEEEAEMEKEKQEREKAQAARQKMMEEKLGKKVKEDIAARLVKDRQAELKEVVNWINKMLEEKKLDVGNGTMLWNEDKLAQGLVGFVVQSLDDKDLKLEPDVLKERVFDQTKETLAKMLKGVRDRAKENN